MNRFGIYIRLLAIAALTAFASLPLSSCGSGTEVAGGGTGGTGISTGAITGFGSVLMNGVHYKTDGEVGPNFHTKKISKGMDNTASRAQDIFRAGMVVSLRHSPSDNNATEIDYAPNLEGPVASMIPGPESAIVVLGQTVIIDNSVLFGSVSPGDFVEVSGFVDNAGRLRATYVDVIRPTTTPNDIFTIQGFVSGLNVADNTFRLGFLPDGSGSTITVSYSPGAFSTLSSRLTNGIYVQVSTTDPEPVSGTIAAVDIRSSSPRTEFPENTSVDLDGLVTRLAGRSGNVLSFELEGKGVRTDDATAYIGGSADNVLLNTRIQIQGTQTGGVLSAQTVIFR